jgi:hypothetical protein
LSGLYRRRLRRRGRHIRRSVNNNLSAGKSAVALRSAHYKSACGVYEELRVLVNEFLRKCRKNNFVNNIFSNLLKRNIIAVLAGNDDRVDSCGNAVVILHSDLRFSVRSEVGQRVVLSYLAQPLRHLVRKRNRQRHKLFRFIAGKAENHTLVARANVVLVLDNPSLASSACQRPSLCPATVRESP